MRTTSWDMQPQTSDSENNETLYAAINWTTMGPLGNIGQLDCCWGKMFSTVSDQLPSLFNSWKTLIAAVSTVISRYVSTNGLHLTTALDPKTTVVKLMRDSLYWQTGGVNHSWKINFPEEKRIQQLEKVEPY